MAKLCCLAAGVGAVRQDQWRVRSAGDTARIAQRVEEGSPALIWSLHHCSHPVQSARRDG